MNQYSPCYILDLDGTLINWLPLNKIGKEPQKLLTGAREFLDKIEKAGCHIVILTGRHPSFRSFTEQQLFNLNIFYHQLVMGVGGGSRFLFNDKKPDGKFSAFAMNVERNGGLTKY